MESRENDQYLQQEPENSSGPCNLETEDFDYSDSSRSRVYKMGAGKFAVELIFRYSWVWLLSCSLLAVGGIALGIVIDLRWLVVALMIIFIVIPFVLAFLYYYYGLRRECYVNTIPHRFIINGEGLTCRLYIPDLNSEKERTYRTRDEFFPYTSMKRFVIGSNSAVIPLRSPAKGFLWIPADSFNNTDHLSALLKLLDARQEPNL